MARCEYRYFNGKTTFDKIKFYNRKDYIAKFGMERSYRDGGVDMIVGITCEGVELPANRRISYKLRPSLHKCDARCTNAKGFNCECSCGGQYHGTGR